MALIPMEYGGGGETLATAAANQTYKAQLRSLFTSYNALNDKEKLSCILMIGNWAVCQIMDVATAGFSRANVQSTVFSYYLNYGNEGKYINNGTDRSTDVNTDTISLLIKE